MPCSIVNRHARYLCPAHICTARVGVVFDASTTRLHCIYSGDGNSMARDCNGGPGDGVSCIPGCAPVGSQCLESTCWCWDCSFPPTHLASALQAQMSGGGETWNEAVVDPLSVESSLPRAVLAFFYESGERGGSDDAQAANRDSARRYQSAFMGEYGVSADFAPIVRLDLDVDQAPFSF